MNNEIEVLKKINDIEKEVRNSSKKMSYLDDQYHRKSLLYVY
jgi:hypothetical protein